MADVYEKNLSSKSSLTVNDYIRVVGSDNVSYKQLVSDVANKIITTYTGASLAGSNQSVKSAIDSLNSKSLNNLTQIKSESFNLTTALDNTGVTFTLDKPSLVCARVWYLNTRPEAVGIISAATGNKNLYAVTHRGTNVAFTASMLQVEAFLEAGDYAICAQGNAVGASSVTIYKWTS